MVAVFSMETQSDFLRILPSTNSMLVNEMQSTVGGFLGPKTDGFGDSGKTGGNNMDVATEG